MGATWGTAVQVTIFGESHGPALGVVLDGLPAGIELDHEAIKRKLARRAPGQAFATPRKEADTYQILSGVNNIITTGGPICALFQNTDAQSRAYDDIKRFPRPSHADYAALKKYGKTVDLRGGGRFSGRLTLPLTFAGAVCEQHLSTKHIGIGAYLKQVGTVTSEPILKAHPPLAALRRITEQQVFPALSDTTAALMKEEIQQAAAQKDSVGGIVECVAWGIPAGYGGPLFEGLEGKIASLAYAVPAVKGVSFGAGFELSALKGSQTNDPMRYTVGGVTHDTNNMGGLDGGITNGMPLVFQAAFKPTPSIGKEQQTVDLEQKATVRRALEGRHDPCVALRAVPVLEAVCAIALCDTIISAGD